MFSSEFELSIGFFLQILFVVGMILQVMGLFSFFIWLRSKPGKPRKGILGPLAANGTASKPSLDRYPGVTIVKPCQNATDNEEENFQNFFKQDYPGEIQLLFSVSSMDAPAVPIIQRALAQYPEVDATLVLSETRRAFWPKTDALYDAHQKVKHEIVIWTDSDSVVNLDYVSEMVAALQKPNVGLVTTPQMDVGANNFGSALKTLANNADVAGLLMLYTLLNTSKDRSWGNSSGFWKVDVDAIPNFWNLMFRYMADDQGLPHQIMLAGKKVEYVNIYSPVHYSNKTVKEVANQKIRWLVPQVAAVGNRYIYFLAGFVAYPIIPAVAFAIVDGFSIRSLQMIGLIVGFRILGSSLAEILFLKSFKMTPRYFWTIPIWDFAQLGCMFIGLFMTHAKFGKRKYRIVDRWFLEIES